MENRNDVVDEKSRKSIIIGKIIILILICGLFSAIGSIIDPIIKNAAAMQQMNTDYLSNTWIRVYQDCVNAAPLVMILFAVILFANDIYKIIKKMWRKLKNEEV